jgi:uncharacterized protein (TIGR00255 family)
MKSARASDAIRSMTGYAQAHAEQDGWSLRVSLRSVNHRFLDVRVRLPEGFDAFEPLIRQRLRDRLRRGHVDVTLHVEAARGTTVHVHREIAGSYLRAVEDLRREFGFSQEPDLVALLRLPGVVDAGAAAGTPGGSAGDEPESELTRRIGSCVDQALERLEEMRQAEGLALAREMHRLTQNIGVKTAEVALLVERCLPAYAQRLKTRLEELLGSGPIEPARLAQEAALLAERADVSEELARLRSHIEQFDGLLSGSGEIGKRLDFLLQEMQREANTLLSKTPGLGAEGLAITELGLQIKAEIEKLREQAQNVE